MDLKQSHAVMEILRRTADSGIGVILVIHDLAAAKRYGDTVFILKNGRLTHSMIRGHSNLRYHTESFDIDSETAQAFLTLN